MLLLLPASPLLGGFSPTRRYTEGERVQERWPEALRLSFSAPPPRTHSPRFFKAASRRARGKNGMRGDLNGGWLLVRRTRSETPRHHRLHGEGLRATTRDFLLAERLPPSPPPRASSRSLFLPRADGETLTPDIIAETTSQPEAHQSVRFLELRQGACRCSSYGLHLERLSLSRARPHINTTNLYKTEVNLTCTLQISNSPAYIVRVRQTEPNSFLDYITQTNGTWINK